jgi:hypothetical protein
MMLGMSASFSLLTQTDYMRMQYAPTGNSGNLQVFYHGS